MPKANTTIASTGRRGDTHRKLVTIRSKSKIGPRKSITSAHSVSTAELIEMMNGASTRPRDADLIRKHLVSRGVDVIAASTPAE